MPDRSSQPGEPGKNPQDKHIRWNEWSPLLLLLILSTGLIIGVVEMAANVTSLSRDGMTLLASVGVNVLIFIAITVQAYIYKGQWDVMNQTVRQTNSIIRAAQRQARSAERALKGSEAAHRIENRPYVGVTGVIMVNQAGIPDSVLGSNLLRITAMVMNCGKTPALNYQTRIYTKVSSFTEIPSEEGEFWPIGLPDKGILLPNVQSGLPADLPPNHETRVAVQNDPQLRLYIWGWLKYDDVWGDHHQTYFAFVNGFRESGADWWACNTGNRMTTNEADTSKQDPEKE